ncbi:MAG: DUF4422 domain-containing protein [Candidatus Gastranaerophilales bacterium]|nr:DUF4422 domain-containing protein [Candidatus Gastranaerophilales bacterium]
MIDVVYLAYYNHDLGYGIDAVENFLNSYNKFSAGIEHNLVIIAKNWTDKAIYDNLCSLVKENNAELIDLPDDGFDIGAFFRAANILKNEYVFFIGSGVSIIKDNWLLLFNNAFQSDDKIQLAGPMGAWEKGISGRFPNPHIRTCAFMINRELFLEYANSQKFPQTKEDTWHLEHCENSLSNFIYRKGYKAVVVNSDGEISESDDWVNSRTYMTPDDSKLIMEDKWVRKYHSAGESLKTYKEIIVWGKNFTKYPSCLVKEFSPKVNIFIPYYEIKDVFTGNIYHPIFGGNITEKLNTEALKDNSGINISHKAGEYGELTSYYWVWKNFLPTINSEYVGFAQNYRMLDFNITNNNNVIFHPVFIENLKKVLPLYNEENIMRCLEGNDVVLPQLGGMGMSVYEQYQLIYPKTELDLGSEIIKELYPEYAQANDEAMASSNIFMFGNFVMKKEILNEFFEWFFNILSVFEERTDWNAIANKYDMVQSVFRAERFFNTWLLYNIKEKNLKVKGTSSFLIYFDMQKYLARCMEDMQKLKQLQQMRQAAQ